MTLNLPETRIIIVEYNFMDPGERTQRLWKIECNHKVVKVDISLCYRDFIGKKIGDTMTVDLEANVTRIKGHRYTHHKILKVYH